MLTTNVIIPIIISFLALLIAYYSWLTNTEPVIAFIWDNEKQFYFIKNVGKGPAMNIKITYIKDKESMKWRNPVLCYSLEPNGIININWGLKNDGTLFIEGTDTGNPDTYLSGVLKIAAVYSSANFLCKRNYTSSIQDDITTTKGGNNIRNWKKKELAKIWELSRGSVVEKNKRKM